MDKQQASKGYECVYDTATHTFNYYGFTVTAACVVNTITAPTGKGDEPVAYDGDETGLASMTSLPVGYYPIRGSAMKLDSGELLLWAE